MPRFRPETIAAASPRVYAGMRSRGCERRALRLLDRSPRTRQDVQGRRFFAALFSLIDDLSTTRFCGTLSPREAAHPAPPDMVDSQIDDLLGRHAPRWSAILLSS